MSEPKRITDLEKFALEHVIRPYANHLGITKRPEKLDMSLDDIARKLNGGGEWADLVLGRLRAIGFSVPNYINHPIADIIRNLDRRQTKSKS